MRWWQVRGETPSGLKLNRAWHVRQLLFALVPPTACLIMFEALRRWDDKHKHTKKMEELKKRAVLVQDQNAAETKAKSESTSFESLRRRVQELERHILTTKDTTTTPPEALGVGVARTEQRKLLVEPTVVDVEILHPTAGVGKPSDPNSRPESSMQRRRRVAAEEAAALKAAATTAAATAAAQEKDS